MGTPRSSRSREPHWFLLILLSAVVGLVISYVGLSDLRGPWAGDDAQDAASTALPSPGRSVSTSVGPTRSPSPTAAPVTAAVQTPAAPTPTPTTTTTPVATAPKVTPTPRTRTSFTISPTSPHSSTDDSNTTTPQLRFWTLPVSDSQQPGQLRTSSGGLRGTYTWVDELSGRCETPEVSWFFTGIPSGAYDIEMYTPRDARAASAIDVTGNLTSTTIDQVDKKGQWTYLFTVRTRKGYVGQTVLDVSARQSEQGGTGPCQATGRRLLFDSVRITRTGSD
ncbi:hypothetical protein [Nocardioides sp.]|uniref:hypothetical protein n=1 Tax=Nocardioides sp. TaxID=35761 RepID=UPI002639B51D|nr:hypothetical protein [Nocardioides sp.]